VRTLRHPVIKKDLEQWFFKATNMPNELLLDDYLDQETEICLGARNATPRP